MSGICITVSSSGLHAQGVLSRTPGFGVRKNLDWILASPGILNKLLPWFTLYFHSDKIRTIIPSLWGCYGKLMRFTSTK